MEKIGLPRILIAPGDEEFGTTLHYMLNELEDLEITTVEDGQSALNYMTKWQFKLLIIDWYVPLVNCHVILDLIAANNRYQRPDRVVVASNTPTLSSVRRGRLANNIDSYLTKPVRYEELQQIVADVITEDSLSDLFD